MSYISVPHVSIIIPTRNRPAFLMEAILSAMEQTFRDREIIVVSNGESPNCEARSLKIAEMARAKWLCLRKGNVSAARNLGISASAGDWIAFLDDDDIWLPEKLERQALAAERSGADMIVCDRVEFWPDGRESVVRRRPPEGMSYLKALNFGKWTALPSAVLVRKAAIIAAGEFDPRFSCCEDGDAWRRIAWTGKIFSMGGEPLLRYRRHPGAVSEDRRLAERADLRHSIKLFFDTPRHLRSEIPSAASIARQWILRRVMPRFLRHPGKTFAATGLTD